MSDVQVPPPPRYLFTLAGTPVQADISAPLSLAGTFGLCWLLVADRYPARGRLSRAAITGLWTGLFMLVFVLHSLGHIISARAAGAPMDALLVNAVHWITLYYNDHVPPEAHLGRAAGGPAANLGTILLSRIIRPLVPAGVLGRDLLDVFALFNAAIAAAALLPTPTFDGGALLKWSVYTQTGDLQQASSVVRRAGWSVSLVLTVCSAGLLVLRRWLVGTILAAFGLVTALESMRRD
jgi:Zn-dependent protease